MLTAIAGTNWGDEGKGRMVDLLSEEYDIVVRYQGGNNAGHTVINDRGEFILNLLPSGILRETVVNVLGNGMVIDIRHLCEEMERLTSRGVKITPENLKISDRAIVCMPYHVMQDCAEEGRLADKKFGSTRRGIAPVYADKYFKKGIRMVDLLELETPTFREHLSDILEWKDLTLERGYGEEKQSFDAMYDHLVTYGTKLRPFICDTGVYLDKAQKAGKKIMLEAQLGALRDVDFGIYPFTSSSNTIAAYGPVGAGIPNHKLDLVIGIMKAYSSCVGEGPFTCELFGEEGDELRQVGHEYGAATGRPRRVGGFDVVASRYGVRMQGADVVALTKLDTLSYLDRIPVCVAYELNGERIENFPASISALNEAKPVYGYLDGWKCDISDCRRFEDLPHAAQAYVLYIERAIGTPIRYISVGAKREQFIERVG